MSESPPQVALYSFSRVAAPSGQGKRDLLILVNQLEVAAPFTICRKVLGALTEGLGDHPELLHKDCIFL
jgi:hypothetical protein